MVSGTVVVRTSNVGCFSIDTALLYVRQLDIDGCIITIPVMPGSQLCFQNDSGKWGVSSMPLVSFTATTTMALQILTTGEKEAQRSTNPYTILRSPGPLKIVVSGGGNYGHEMSIARRLAHDLGVYYKLDADIVLDTEMVLPSPDSTATITEPELGNIVVISSPSGRYIRECLDKGKTAFSIVDQQDGGPPLLQLRGETLNESSQGILFLLNMVIRYLEHRSQVSYSHIHTEARHRLQCCSSSHSTDRVWSGPHVSSLLALGWLWRIGW